MHTEKQKMLAGEHYNSLDPELVEDRRKARLAYHQLNQLAPEIGRAHV